jgi:hypothetical protein
MMESRIEKISKRQKRQRTKITIQFRNGRKEIAPESEEMMMMMMKMMIYELLLLQLLPLQGKKNPDLPRSPKKLSRMLHHNVPC